MAELALEGEMIAASAGAAFVLHEELILPKGNWPLGISRAMIRYQGPVAYYSGVQLAIPLVLPQGARHW